MRILNSKLPSLLFALVTLAVSSPSFSGDNALSTYKAQALKLMAQIDAKDNGIQASAHQLVALSKPILTTYEVRYPECTEYLQALSAVADELAHMPLSDIESGYHSDGKLPPLKNANCYHAKDLLVHPATVEALAIQGINRDEEWAQAHDEIDEVLEHFTLVQRSLSQSAQN